MYISGFVPRLHATSGVPPLQYCFLPDLYLLDDTSMLPTSDCIRILLRAGADPDQLNNTGHSATVIIAAMLHYSEPLELLISHGANINLRKLELEKNRSF